MASPWRSDENLASSSRIWDWDNENDGLTDNDTPHTANLPPQAASQETPFQQLIRHWMNERHSPVILPAQEILLGRLLDHIRKQSDDVQLLRADPDSSEEEHFRIMLVQTEIERVKFVLRSYIRTRLHKVEKYAQYITLTDDVHPRLSKGEVEHATRYAQLLETHFTTSVLRSLPEDQRSIDDEVPFIPPMISKPDIKCAVFAHARQTCPPIRLPDGSTLEMEKGQISLTPYEVVEQLLAREEVELV